MSEQTCKAVFLSGFFTVLAIRIYFAQQVKSSQVADDRKTIPEILLLLMTFLGMFLLPLIGVFTPWLKFADYHLPSWTGLVGTMLHKRQENPFTLKKEMPIFRGRTSIAGYQGQDTINCPKKRLYSITVLPKR